MTKEWAVRMLRGLYLLAENQEEKEAILMAIEALKQQDKRCKICKYFHDINSRVFEYYCPNCGAHMEVRES
jgi:predicted RNA-binding Zn-ribbon protein involved in translation (DUF1610 family)